jgi:hypothetical protein
MQPPDPPPLWLRIAASLLLLPLVGIAAEPKPVSASSPAKSKAGTESQADPASAGAGLTNFGRQIPAQRPNRGIYIPTFTAGQPSSIIEADVITRIDDSRLLAESMTIHLYGDQPAEHVTVKMPSATYNMTNQILRSSERSKVSRADFDLEGDALIFDTTSSQGRMTGNVRMTIHDAGSLLKPAPPAAPGSKSAPKSPALSQPEPAKPLADPQAKPQP